jgi:hypothetical protein
LRFIRNDGQLMTTTPPSFPVGSWAFSAAHGESVRIVDVETVWNHTVYQVFPEDQSGFDGLSQSDFIGEQVANPVASDGTSESMKLVGQWDDARFEWG